MAVEVNVSVEGRDWRSEAPEVQAGLTGLGIVVRSVLEADQNADESWIVTEGTHPDDLPAIADLFLYLHGDVNRLRPDLDPAVVEWHGETRAATSTAEFESFMDEVNAFGPAYSLTPDREQPGVYDLRIYE